ncbi:unnamed protein product [Mytilus coruscus]|uniref:EGF-like domain-containing protein n=1 Tax=Mytilus coruscus TaxID=42192 RepID=A0A6J8A9S8_MYTCO|nr:unnamed protein product [Mytilus coruscus]
MHLTALLLLAYVNGVITMVATDPNVCPRKVTISEELVVTQQQFVVECCPNYFEDDGRCKECSPGTFGKDCKVPCLANHFGFLCKEMCNCSGNMKCDPVTGCVCKAGLTGPDCIQECPNDMYGDNCNTSCNCSVHADCDSVSGKCTCHEGFVGEMCELQENRQERDQPNYSLVIYITLVGILLCMIFVVRIAMKAKQRMSKSIIDVLKWNERQQSRQPKAILRISHRTTTELGTNVPPTQNEDVYYEISDVDSVGAY